MIKKNQLQDNIMRSWSNHGQPVHSTEELLEWIRRRNADLQINISPSQLSLSDFWRYDEKCGRIVNQNQSFFSVCGVKAELFGKQIEQPIILQNEIGYLGIICKSINGCLYFLMQAKIEPGNINHIQISPTIQATKSNFTQKHGGKQPPYLNYFLHAEMHEILVDQIQSEQSSRFWKKRNRNIIVMTQADIEVLPSHRWMTLHQIKALMRYDNLVNMDTRTVIACIPFSLFVERTEAMRPYFRDESLYRSIFYPNENSILPSIYHAINNYKMFSDFNSKKVRLDELQNWEMDDMGIRCKRPYSFSLAYFDIEIEGREVRHWTQPLFRSSGRATFGLYTTVLDDKRHFLVHITSEIGCFDKVELGPTVQLEAICDEAPNAIEQQFLSQWKRRQGVLHDVRLSEEGGRFYQEENYNVILEVDAKDVNLPKEYFWVDYYTLNLLAQVNNCLNIQLRNLLSLLEV